MASVGKLLSRQPMKTLNYCNFKENCLLKRNLSRNSFINRKILAENRHKLLLQSRQSLCLNKVLSSNKLQQFSTSVEADSRGQVLDPYTLVETEITALVQDIKQELRTNYPELEAVAEYYFDGKGKAFRPMLVMVMAKALNFHMTGSERLLPSQQQIAMIAEMIHTASLMHDDVIDHADTRRGKTSINLVWGQRKAIFGGDYVMAMASATLANIRNNEVVSTVSQITEDLVRGEFMQLGSKEQEEERFNHYLTKTFKKTASLLANSCKAVAILCNCDQEMADAAYNYGKNVGISFQLIDDLLDFTSCDHVMGKPTAADLKLGLATAPVLFAARRYPNLNALIMRRFSQEGDVERARELVAKSNGVEETRALAKQHSEAAVELTRTWNQSDSLRALHLLANMVLTRTR